MTAAPMPPCGCRPGQCHHAAHPELPPQRECQHPERDPVVFTASRDVTDQEAAAIRGGAQAGSGPDEIVFAVLACCVCCYVLPEGADEPLDAVTVLAGYAVCEPHLAIVAAGSEWNSIIVAAGYGS